MDCLTEPQLLDAARRGEHDAFQRLVEPYRGELRAHCYRMFGGFHDAEDAVQDALVGAWRGIGGFEGRSSVRSWLYRIATNACLKEIARRPKRLLSADRFPAIDSMADLGEPVLDQAWVEPYPQHMDPQDRYELREAVELSYIAALQHLPGTQRAVLILREVLAFSAAEVAQLMETSVASVNSALQRARKTLEQRTPAESQQAALSRLGESGQRDLVANFVAAWERADIPALLELLTEDARLTMPPLPAWFDGRESVRVFFETAFLGVDWRLRPIRANGQLAFAFYQAPPNGPFRLGGVNVLTLRDERVAEITGFLDPAMYQRFDLPTEIPR